MLEPATPNDIPDCIVPPPPPVDIEGELEYKVLEILDSKIDRCRCCKLLYHVRWSGYEGTDQEFSWIPADEMHADEMHADDLLTDFHSVYPDKPGPHSHL